MSVGDNRVVMISGANRGIGRAVAEHLYARGYQLSLGARNPGLLAQVFAGCESERVAFHRYDAEDKSTHQAWVDATVAQFGRVDGLVNNAGIALSVDLEDDNEADLDRLWSVNVKAPLSMTRKCMPHPRRSGRGRVINIASVAGKVVFGSGVGYSMSKFALVAISHATRQAAWDDGVRCTAVCPGYVATDMTSEVESTTQDLMIKPSDIAALVATAMELSNNASVAELIVNCRPDPTM